MKAKIKDLEQQLQSMNDEEILMIILHTIRDRLRSKEIKNLGIFQEIIRELEQAGI